MKKSVNKFIALAVCFVMLIISPFDCVSAKKGKEEEEDNTEVRYEILQAASYAKRYNGASNSPYGKNSYNTDYAKLDSDCTNFVSQCLLAGGYKMHGSYTKVQQTSSEKTVDEWYHYKIAKKKGGYKYRYTTSWVCVQQYYNIRPVNWGLYYYIKNNVKTATMHKKVKFNAKKWLKDYNLMIGDIVQMDTNADGKYDHSIIITEIKGNNIYYCGHTENRYNKSLNQLAQSNKEEAKEKPLKVKEYKYVIIHPGEAYFVPPDTWMA